MKYIKDVLYGHIEISDKASKFIDTYEFQRLRRIKQLSTSFLIFPSVCHTRFEHSIGVYHLTGKVLEHLCPDIEKDLLELVKLSGLLHDIGHMAFSHSFDHHIIPKLKNKDLLKDHEYRSVLLIKEMNKKYSIGLSKTDINFMEHCINGTYMDGMSKYLFQILCNSEHGLDTDKLDYLLRDSFYINQHSPFDISYLILNMKIIDDEVCFNDKSLVTLFKVFNTRFTLHKEMYQHNSGLATEMMIRDIFLKNKDKFGLEEIHKDFGWLKITDDLIYTVNDELLDRLYSRKLYKVSYKKTDDPRIEKYTKFLSYSSVKDFYKKLKFFTDKKNTEYYTYDQKPSIFRAKLNESETIFFIK